MSNIQEKKKIQIPNGRTVKLSKFKSEYNEKQQEEQQIKEIKEEKEEIKEEIKEKKIISKVFKNEVKEVNNIVVKDIIKLEPTGFPKPKLHLNLGSKSNNLKIKEINERYNQKQKVEQKEEINYNNSNNNNTNNNTREFNKNIIESQNESTDFDENLEKVLSMTPEEVENSLTQLSLMFSAENLEFLKSRGAPKDIPKDIPKKHIKQNLDSQEKIEPKDYIAKTSEELQQQLQIAPIHVKKSLQWTLDTNEVVEDTFDKKSSNEKLILAPRYDLQGSRIVITGINQLNNQVINSKENEKTMFQEWFEIFKNSFLSRVLSSNEIQEIITLSISKLLSAEFIFEIKTDQQGELEFIPELDHHEFCRGMPGYNLLETCEFLRSEVPSQRLIGDRIITGVLLRRDIATSAEAYYSNNPIHSLTSINTIYDKYYWTYSYLVNNIINRVSNTLKISEQNEEFFQKQKNKLIQMNRDISRLLTYTILKTCCTTDFPPELSSILVRNVVTTSSSYYSHSTSLSSNRNGMQELSSLRTLLMFIQCKQETRAYDILLGLSGISGWNTRMNGSRGLSLPPLPMPHARRVEVTYPGHLISCLINSYKVKDDLKMNNNNNEIFDESFPNPEKLGAAKTPQEEFSLLCRWDRGTTILTVGSWKLSQILMGSICGSMEFIIDEANKIRHGKEQLLNIQGYFLNAVDIGSVALRILSSSLRASPSTLTSTSENGIETTNFILYNEIFIEVIQELWSIFQVWNQSWILLIQYLSPSEHSKEINSIQQFTKNLWKFLCDFILGKREYCEWLISKGILTCILEVYASHSYPISNLSNNTFNIQDWSIDNISYEQILHEPYVWMLRFFRFCLGYNLGLSYVLDLIATLQQISSSGSLQNIESWIPKRWSDQVKTEFIMLLEETSLSCSFLILSILNSSSSTNISNLWNQMSKTDNTTSDLKVMSLDLLIDLSRILLRISQGASNWLWSQKNNIFKQNDNSHSNESNIIFTIAITQFLSTIIGCHENFIKLTNSSTLSSITTFKQSELILSTFLRGPGLLYSLNKYITRITSNLSSENIEPISQVTLNYLITDIETTKQILRLNESYNSSFLYFCQEILDNLDKLILNYDSLNEVIYVTFYFALKRLYFSTASYGLITTKSNNESNQLFISSIKQECQRNKNQSPIPYVSNGLIVLQTYQIIDSITFINLQISSLLDTIDLGNSISLCLKSLPILLDGFPKLTYYLLVNIITQTLTTTNDNSILTSDLQIVSSIVKSILRSGEKQVSEDQDNFGNTISIETFENMTTFFTGFSFFDAVSFPFTNQSTSSSSSSSSSSLSTTTTTTTTSIPFVVNNDTFRHFQTLTYISESPITGISPGIHHEWMYHCLKGLKGKYLARWLQVLCKIHQTEISKSYERDYGKLMYWICRLAVSEISLEKTQSINTIDNEIIITSNELNIDEDPLSYSLNEYEVLMGRALEYLWNESQTRSTSAQVNTENLSVYEDIGNIFCQESALSAEVSLPISNSSSNSSTSNIRGWEDLNSKLTENSTISRSAKSGLHDLVGRLIERASSQTHDPHIHSISLIPLILPGFLPWSERIRLWREIGCELRILHILEHQEFMMKYLPVFLISGVDSPLYELKDKGSAVERVILDALLHLRSYNDDKNLLIVEICQYTLSRYIFYDIISKQVDKKLNLIDIDEESIIIQSSRGKFLHYLVSRCKESNYDLLLDILRFYSVLEKTEILLRSKSEKSISELGTEIITIWRNNNSSDEYKQVLVNQNDKFVTIQQLLNN